MRYIAAMTLRRIAVVVITVLLAAACGPRTRRVQRLPLPTTGSPEARRQFDSSQNRFGRDGHAQLTEEFEAIIQEFPDDPIAPYAMLYAGMAALRAGSYERALENLDKLDPAINVDAAVMQRAQLYKGLALGYLGRHTEALPLLRASGNAVNPGDDNELAEWHAAMAEASAATGAVLGAVTHYDAWWAIGRDSEKAYAVNRIEALVTTLDDATVQSGYRALKSHDGPAAAILGIRYEAALVRQGLADRAEDVADEIADARRALGMSSGTQVRSGGGDPGRLGAILPMTGRQKRIGDLAMRGLSMSSGVSAVAGTSATLRVRDSSSVASGAAAAIDDLAQQQVIAVVGPVGGKAVDRAADRAGRIGLPLVSLSSRPESQKASSSYVFHVVHSAESRARALARYATKNKIKDFAILAPKNGYGRAVGDAFAREVERLGGAIVVRVDYKPNTTSFKKDVRKLRKPWQAIFIPDRARKLELIAPALAYGNFLARPLAQRKRGGKRKVLLLSTAEGIGERYIRAAGRYSWGGVFAPGFYPDRTDSQIGPFVNSYYSSFGRLPTGFDAYAYDAGQAVLAAVRSGATNREQLSRALAGGKPAGVTGQIAFGTARTRIDDGVLYTVERLASGDFEIRALR